MGHTHGSGLALVTARQFLTVVRQLHLQQGYPMSPELPGLLELCPVRSTGTYGLQGTSHIQQTGHRSSYTMARR